MQVKPEDNRRSKSKQNGITKKATDAPLKKD